MSIKKLVLVLGLLGGVNASLNAVKPEHEARLKQLSIEWNNLNKEHEKNQKDLDYLVETGTAKTEDLSIFRSKVIGFCENRISLMEEVLRYLEIEDYKDRIDAEKALYQAKKDLDFITKYTSSTSPIILNLKFFLDGIYIIFWNLFPEIIKMLFCIITVWLFWVWKNNLSVLSKKSMKFFSCLCLWMLLAAILSKITLLVLK